MAKLVTAVLFLLVTIQASVMATPMSIFELAGNMMTAVECSNSTTDEYLPGIYGCDSYTLCRQGRPYQARCPQGEIFKIGDKNRACVRGSCNNRQDWFECTKSGDRGQAVGYKKDAKIYGICVYEGVVVFIRKCNDDEIFVIERGGCVKKTNQ